MLEFIASGILKMSSVPHRRYSVEEYYALEKASNPKYEYLDGLIYPVRDAIQPSAMERATLRHNVIVLNIAAELRAALRMFDCTVFPSDMRIACPSGLRAYPDAGFFCGPADLELTAGLETLRNPTLIVEVLSPSTESFGRETKLDNYFSIPSLRGYVLVSQTQPRVEYFSRREVGDWRYSVAQGLTESLLLLDFDITLSLAEIYAKVELPPEELWPDESRAS